MVFFFVFVCLISVVRGQKQKKKTIGQHLSGKQKQKKKTSDNTYQANKNKRKKPSDNTYQANKNKRKKNHRTTRFSFVFVCLISVIR
jgi:hypothetical protein